MATYCQRRIRNNVTTHRNLALNEIQTNVVTIDDDEYNYLVTRNTRNYSENANYAVDEELERPMLEYDTLIDALGTGSVN